MFSSFCQALDPFQISSSLLISIVVFQDGATFLSLPQAECPDFFTHKTNSSSASGGNESLHSDPLITPPSDAHFSPNKSKSSSGSGVTVGSYLPNWSEFFPPPPNCPPSDNESTLNTPLINRNQQKVEFLQFPFQINNSKASNIVVKQATLY